MPRRDELRAFLYADDAEPRVDTAPAPRSSRRADLRAFLYEGDGEEQTQGRVETAGPLRTAVLSAADTVPFAKQIGATLRAPVEAVRERGLAGLADPGLLLEAYRENRDAFTQGLEQSQEENPVASGLGTGAGIAAQVARGDPRNLVSAARAVPGLVRSAPAAARAIPSAVRGLASREALSGAAKGAGGGAAYGAAYGLSDSDADLTRGEFADALEDTAEGAGYGAAFGGTLGGLAGGTKRGLAARAERTASRAAQGRAVEEYDAARTALPEQRAAAKATNAQRKAAYQEDVALARAEANAANRAGREAYAAETSRATDEARAATRTARAAANAEAKASTDVARARALEEAERPTRDRALIVAGLEGKQRTLGGPSRAKARGEAAFDEPVSRGNPEGGRIVERVTGMGPEEGLQFTRNLRDSAGKELRVVREELAGVNGASSEAGRIKTRIRGAVRGLPSDAQQRALEQLDGMVDDVTRDGKVSPNSLRKLVEDVDALIGYGSPNLEAVLGRKTSGVLRSARSAFVEAEQELIGQYLPSRLPEYREQLQRYGTLSDIVLGAEEKLRRVNAGQRAIRYAKPAKVAKTEPRTVDAVAPRAVPEFQPVEPRRVSKPERVEVRAPQFEGGNEALREARRALEVSPAARFGVELAGGALGALGGSAAGGVPGAFIGREVGGAIGRTLAERWLATLRPNAAGLALRSEEASAALERWAPVLEKAMRDGPQAVVAAHVVLSKQDPEYRAAFEEREP